MITALYNPGKGTVGCVILQVCFGGSSEVSHMFDVADWDVVPEEGQRCMRATEEQWRQIAAMRRAERVERFNTHKTENDNV